MTPAAVATRPIPFARPDISEAEIEAVVRVLRSEWLTTGPEVKSFETEFASYVGAEHAVALNSCTAALHLALEAMGVGPGDEVLTSTWTFTATAEVAEYLGARARFVDVEPENLNITPQGVRQIIEAEYERRAGVWRHRESGNRLRGVIPVHFGGQPCDMNGFLALAREYDLAIVDDAAHALPASIGDRMIGGFGCATAFSFYATKTLTTAEGGMLCTDDAAVSERARIMSLHGISRDAWKRYSSEGNWYYEVVEAGFKYNLTDIAAAMGRVQLHRLESLHNRRTAIAAKYTDGFAGNRAIHFPSVVEGTSHAWHLFPIRLELERLRIDRATFIDELRRRGVGTSVHFIPLHRQPFYAERYGYQRHSFPVAEAAYQRLVSLPIYSRMSDEDVAQVIAAVGDITEEHHA